MIYDFEKKFLFVHIPRTAGMSISHAMAERIPSVVIDSFERRHYYAYQIFREFEEFRKEWDFLYKFAIIRNPWEIIVSDYNLTMRDVSQMTESTAAYTLGKWYNRLKRAKEDPGFESFVRREYLGGSPFTFLAERGFWRTWCMSVEGADLGFVPIRFERLKEMWPVVCERIGIEPFELPVVNEVPKMNAYYTPALRDAVGEYCDWDIIKFGYSFPEHLGKP